MSEEEEDKRRDGLDEAQVALQAMYMDGKYTKQIYFGCLLQLAKNWVDAGDRQEARDIVALLDEEFLTSTLPRLMQDDPGFHDTVHTIALALAEGTERLDESDIDLAILRGPVARA